MHILIVSSRYYPEVGAAPSRITNLAESLQAAGHSVDVITCLPNHPQNRIYDGYRHCFSRKEVVHGVTVWRYWCHASVSTQAFSRAMSMFSFAVTLWSFVFKVQRIRHYDKVILQTPTIVSAASAMRLFKGLYHKPVLLNVSDLWPLTGVTLGAMREGSTSYRYMARLERYLYTKADAVIGQSQEILDYVLAMYPKKRTFLYRNLQPEHACSQSAIHQRHTPLRIVYAGMFGVAQDILNMIRKVDFKKVGAELHLYGGGSEKEEIERYLATTDCSVHYHGYISKQEMNDVLSNYDVSIVPLVTHIVGAVPSKLFDMAAAGIPILFCGGGEGAHIVQSNAIGCTSVPGDYATLERNVEAFVSMSDAEYSTCVESCCRLARTEFSYEDQLRRFLPFIES